MNSFGAICSARRYYLARHRYLYSIGDDLWREWEGKQKAEPGTVLPLTFPALTALNDAGYYALEDLDGATVDELIEARLTRAAANAVIAAALAAQD